MELVLETRDAFYVHGDQRTAILAWDGEGNALVGGPGCLVRAETLGSGTIVLPTPRERFRERAYGVFDVALETSEDDPVSPIAKVAIEIIGEVVYEVLHGEEDRNMSQGLRRVTGLKT